MTSRTRLFGWTALVALALLAGGPLAVESGASSCTGVLYDFYATSACVVLVGTKVSCPGFPDEWDVGPDGNQVQTPYFTTQSVTCPCSGGGGLGDGERTEDEG
ncbi:MAG: hypothetical protein AAF604_15650 [Acidobacteriota bacterium]